MVYNNQLAENLLKAVTMKTVLGDQIWLLSENIVILVVCDAPETE